MSAEVARQTILFPGSILTCLAMLPPMTQGQRLDLSGAVQFVVSDAAVIQLGDLEHYVPFGPSDIKYFFTNLPRKNALE